ncbi:MAG: hypothetical protein IPI49_19510 [Myxococcales bacterium]|nr:hypothetical protein [Myxococcales bacterium]
MLFVRNFHRRRPMNESGGSSTMTSSTTKHRGVGGAQTLALAALAGVACSPQPPEAAISGQISGRVLMAPGVGLANANVVIEQIELYDDARVAPGQIRRHHLDVTTDANGFFGPVSAKDYAGVFRLRTQGGEYRDPISGARIRFDPAQELRALHFMDFFGARADMTVTPVHTVVEARFRYLVSKGEAPLAAVDHAYADIRQHFGDLDWQHVIPAEVNEPTVSPTDAYRAAFLLGGWAVLADDLRLGSDSTPQAVNLMTMTHAAAEDLATDLVFDGNDGNQRAAGSGLQVGLCDPVPPTCQVAPSGCQLGACRARCDLYANTFRAGLAAGTRKYVGSKSVPSSWNQTALGSEDIRGMLAHVAGNPAPELFGDVCFETSDRVEPTIIWEVAPANGQAIKGTLTLRVRAIDDAEAMPTITLVGMTDEDGAPTNASATVTLDTRTLNGGVDGDLLVVALAKDLAGNTRRSERSFRIDNTAPTVALDDSDFYVDTATGVRWTAAPGPMLHGVLSEARVESVEVLVAGTVAATATVSGDSMSWSAQLPEGRITSSGAEVVIRARDQAGNVTTTPPVLARLDATPPSVLVEPSLVYDERLSREIYEDDVPNNVWVQRHLVQGAPVDLAQSMQGACVTLGKYSHLLSSSLPLGAAGSLNPLRVTAVVADDGVGVAPGTTQMRVTVNGAEVLPWTAVAGTPIAPLAKRHELNFYRDGALAIAGLATTEGQYLLELRAVDLLGRVSQQARCWNHKVLAPKLKLTPGAETGSIASGFSRALYSTSLNPQAGQFGDVSAKLLNATPQGAAVWQWRVKNYVAAPIYVTVNIAQPVNADLTRTFVVRSALISSQPDFVSCGSSPCTIAQPIEHYRGTTVGTAVHQGVRFRARMFVASGQDLGSEIQPCPGCSSNDDIQTYTFEVPARTTQQGVPLPEYVFLTYLRPALASGGGQGLNHLLAPMDATWPDTDPAPYVEFSLGDTTMTGKLIGAPSPSLVCTSQEFDGEVGQWFCNQRARYQRYRALTSATYRWLLPVKTDFQTRPSALLPSSDSKTGVIRELSLDLAEVPSGELP